jgi:hypothetical protein
MSALLITYDLHKPGQNYAKFMEAIKSYPWAKLSESSYAIATYESAASIHSQLKPHMDNNDNLYVVRLSQDWQGWGPPVVNQWLNTNL